MERPWENVNSDNLLLKVPPREVQAGDGAAEQSTMRNSMGLRRESVPIGEPANAARCAVVH